MNLGSWLYLSCALALFSSTSFAHEGEGLPPGFVAEPVVGGWNQPIDMAFLPDGRLLVAEKAGLVWMVDGGVKSAAPILDLTEEVGDFGSRGLKSLALDPDFANNELVYLLYDMDRHHLFYFGTASYDPLMTDNNGATIARITRYALDPTTQFTSTVPGSRFVLLGESPSTGFPLIDGHQSGMLRFGNDGSLLASCGDGAPVDKDFGGGPKNAAAILDGILSPGEDVGSFRAQLVDSLSGKVVRIDRRTGDGIASNPYFDAAAPRSARSRVWVSGFRNPFRIEVVPNSAPGPGHPGTVLIGDVGRSHWEEIDRSTVGGENFGWPLYEGMNELGEFATASVDNSSAPNPLFGQTIPGVGLCTKPFFTFQELLVQESLNTPVWRNDCDTQQLVPASAFPSMHTRPVVDWNHAGPARVGGFDASGNAIEFVIDDPLSPIQGSNFEGACAMGGTWVGQGSYPSSFHDSYVFSDFTKSWIKNLRFDAAGTPFAVGEVAAAVGNVVSMAVDPLSGDIYYLQLSTLPMLPGVLVHLAYYSGNVPPFAVAERAPAYGPSPLTVKFHGENSEDPEGAALSYAWDFGDGTPISTLESPVHVFPSMDVTAKGLIVAQVFELVPPQVIDMTTGLFPAVIQDGYFINPAAPLASELYLTLYEGVDPDPEDWIGYKFSKTYNLHEVVFQEALEVGTDGGWFENLTVDVLVGGVWTGVTGLSITPPYGGKNGIFYETYELMFDPVLAEGVRVRGLAGGTKGFVSVGELRALALPPPTGLPTQYDVTLVVTDDVSLTSQASTSVWIDNTPPTAVITSPLNGGTYDPTQLEHVTLTSSSSDLESPAGSLTCNWQVNLHHNDHWHPEPEIQACASSIDLAPHIVDNEIYYWEVTLTVTDPEGLSTKVTSMLYSSPPTLVAESYTVSLLEGGVTKLVLKAGPAHASELYFTLLSAAGTFPGVDLGSVIIPLNFDGLFLLPLTSPSLGMFAGFSGMLDSSGEGPVAFGIPPATYSGFAGITLNFAYVASSGAGTIDFVSNTVPLTLDF